MSLQPIPCWVLFFHIFHLFLFLIHLYSCVESMVNLTNERGISSLHWEPESAVKLIIISMLLLFHYFFFLWVYLKFEHNLTYQRTCFPKTFGFLFQFLNGIQCWNSSISCSTTIPRLQIARTLPFVCAS